MRRILTYNYAKLNVGAHTFALHTDVPARLASTAIAAEVSFALSGGAERLLQR